MSNPGRKYFTVYSAQKQKETGSGCISMSHLINDPEIDQRIKDAKELQAKENKEYKLKLSKGEIVPQKYFRKDRIRVECGIPLITPPPPAIVSRELAQAEPNTFPRTPFVLQLDGGTGNSMFVIGSSKRGKSTALMKIYDKYYAGKDIVSVLWTVNPQIALYKKHKKLIVADRWTKESADIIRLEQKIQRRTNNAYKFLNILDDILHVKGTCSQLMDDLIMTYRNSKMSTIISMQYSNMLQKACRANVNNVLLFGLNTDEAIKVVIDTYLFGYLKSAGITHTADMMNWYKKMTTDHAFIYVRPAANIISFHKFNI